MIRRCMIVLSVVFLMTSFFSVSWADEAKDHICFRVLDTDKDGQVTFEEFARHYGQDEARFKAADVDLDGKLTHEEYHTFLGHGS